MNRTSLYLRRGLIGLIAGMLASVALVATVDQPWIVVLIGAAVGVLLRAAILAVKRVAWRASGLLA